MAAAVIFPEFTEAAAVDFPDLSGAFPKWSSGNRSSLLSSSDGFAGSAELQSENWPAFRLSHSREN